MDQFTRAVHAMLDQPSAIAALKSGDQERFAREAGAILYLHLAKEQKPTATPIERFLEKSRPHIWVPIGIGFFWAAFTVAFVWSLAPELRGQLDLTMTIVLGFCAFFTGLGYVAGWYQGRRDTVRSLAARAEHDPDNVVALHTRAAQETSQAK